MDRENLAKLPKEDPKFVPETVHVPNLALKQPTFPRLLLPFDDFEPSPLRLDGRVHLVVPTRFTTKVRATFEGPHTV